METDALDIAATNGLNSQQLLAVQHGLSPLLVVAGAGSGKTRTLVHRVAFLIQQGIAPSRILLLTFTRRAAAEMLRRVDYLLREGPAGRQQSAGGGRGSCAIWGGTFHAIAARLLRMHASSVGLEPDFSIVDRGDAEDLMDVVRTELGLTNRDKRFPRKGTCLAIYSQCVNAGRPLEKILTSLYPWCQDHVEPLKNLFRAYGERKEQAGILDYDDLLLFWRGMLTESPAGDAVRDRFECVLVDEYQDTNRVQADILRALRPGGQGLTVVGDDAQSIYSFRAATIRNVLDFPEQFPGTTVVTLEQNYRSTQSILDATNAVIAQASERYSKQLWTHRKHGEPPRLVVCHDENEQADYLIARILQRREFGIDLRNQAVLFRASHHSVLLEAELTRHNIPYVKYGGLKFLEVSHVKDLMSFLRLAENPRDLVAGTRVLQLLPGIGPKRARQLMDMRINADGRLQIWVDAAVPLATQQIWPDFTSLMVKLNRASKRELPTQIRLVRQFYDPLLEEKYDNATPRKRDLEQIEQLASRYPDRQTLLTEMALDPPETTEDFAGAPLLDEDYLILSTIHSAKGLEWDTVYVIHAADGNIPSDMATGSAQEIEEELRLFYVALTRAKQELHVCYPQRYYQTVRGSFSDKHGYAQRTRFITAEVERFFQRCVTGKVGTNLRVDAPEDATAGRRIRQQIQDMWT